MRILIVSHPPLDAELGAAQVALSLAAALRARGHDCHAWSPEPLPAGTRWWNKWLRQRRAIERFAAAAGPFDVIDTPAVTASRELGRWGALLVRSTQPELLYLRLAIRDDLRRPTPRALAHSLLGLPLSRAIVRGWRRARAILCLGSLELAWMRRRFPFWSPKLGHYVIAVPAAEQAALAAVRRGRPPLGPGGGLRFLWLGRWTAHKGTRRLLRFLAERLAAAPADSFTLAGCGALAAAEVPRAWLAAGRVRLIPSFRRAELPPLLAEHQAGLFTSDLEGWGLSLNEMLESGMTVFATEAGGVPDLRPFFPSRLRPFPPPVAPAAAILAGDPREDLAANGYYTRFSWDEIARGYEQAIVELHAG